VFSTPQWLTAYKTFTTAAFVAFTSQTLLFSVGAFTQWSWVWPVSSISALCAILLAAMCIQADNTPFCHGANDNASAVGLVLTLAEYFQDNPLDHTCLWFICTGCEEVQHYGAIDFFKRNRTEFYNPKALIFEMLGCDGPSWLVKEGIIIPFHASKEMVDLAEGIAQEYPELDAYPSSINGGNTEMADALRVGIPAITFVGFTKEGEAPYWHMLEDTIDKIDIHALERNFKFTRNYILALDSQAR
jgi:Zn-dependent M28 family amino/carboxypeptidase